MSDHWNCPTNIGEIENPDGLGVFSDPGCQDVFWVYIKVQAGRIADIRCKVLGCHSAGACGSALAELTKGKTVDEALRITNEDVLRALGGTPDPADPRPNLGADALHRAVFDYLARTVPSAGWTFWSQAVGEVTRVAEVSEGVPPAFPRLSEITVFPRFAPALAKIEEATHLWILWWMHGLPAEARDTLEAHPRGDKNLPIKGVFALRSPARPNPIGLRLVRLVERQEHRLLVDGLDARPGSPILDIKPWTEGDVPR